MSKVLVTDTHLTNIANAIREKNGETTTYKPSEMATAITNLPSGGDTSIEDGLVSGTLTKYSNNRITNIRDYTFYMVTSLNSIDLPMVDTLGSYSFSGCSNLTEVNIPSVNVIHSVVFYKCSKLTKIILPSLNQVQGSSFSECTKLALVDCYQKVKFNGTGIFKKCNALTTLILRSSTVCELYNSNNFESTPIESGTGYIYVPASLIDTYKTATNWTAYANQFRAIEDYPDICGEVTS